MVRVVPGVPDSDILELTILYIRYRTFSSSSDCDPADDRIGNTSAREEI